MPVNAQYRLAARPSGLPKDSDWQYTEEAVPSPGEGEFLVEVQYLSLDPAMRTWMNPGRSYVPPVGIGEVMRAGGIGKVVESRHPGFTAGQSVFGTFGVQNYAVSDGKDVQVVDTSLAPAPVFLGTLGISGITAYFGLFDVGAPGAGPDRRGVRGGRVGRHRRRPAREASTAAASSASPAARRSAGRWSRSTASTPPSTTAPGTSART